MTSKKTIYSTESQLAEGWPVSWSCASVTEKLNQEFLGTRPAGFQNGCWTRQISCPQPKSLDNAVPVEKDDVEWSHNSMTGPSLEQWPWDLKLDDLTTECKHWLTIALLQRALQWMKNLSVCFFFLNNGRRFRWHSPRVLSGSTVMRSRGMADCADRSPRMFRNFRL